jgi:hypothetical protein
MRDRRSCIERALARHGLFQLPFRAIPFIAVDCRHECCDIGVQSGMMREKQAM